MTFLESKIFFGVLICIAFSFPFTAMINAFLDDLQELKRLLKK